MLVRSYLEWCSRAPARERAEAAGVLARAYLSGHLGPDDRHEAEAALTLALDDSSALVRRALAEVFCAAEDAPRHIVSALAGDQGDVGALVLARSPLLTDEQLVDYAALGDTLSQIAIAMRADLSGPVAAAIAEIGCREALIVLVRNVGADVPVFSLSRMMERVGDEGEFREALLERPGLPVAIRQQLAGAVAQALGGFLKQTGWVAEKRVDRLIHEASHDATLLIGAQAGDGDLTGLVRHLRGVGQLTPALVLRGLLCGDTRLFVAALAELAQLPRSRVAGIVHERAPAALSALYRKAGMPASLEAAFAVAIHSIARRRRFIQGGRMRLQRRVIADVLVACEAQPTHELGRLVAVLHRFHAEAVRDEARELTAGILAAPAPITMQPAEEAPMLTASRDLAAPAEAPGVAYVEPVVEQAAAWPEQEVAELAEEVAAVAAEAPAAAEPENRPQEVLAPTPADRLVRVDGDGFMIPFDPYEYALRKAA